MKNVRCLDCGWLLDNEKFRECTAPSPACINDGPRYVTPDFILMWRTCDSFERLHNPDSEVYHEVLKTHLGLDLPNLTLKRTS